MVLGATNTNLESDASTSPSGANHAFHVGSGTCRRSVVEHLAHNSVSPVIFPSRSSASSCPQSC